MAQLPTDICRKTVFVIFSMYKLTIQYKTMKVGKT